MKAQGIVPFAVLGLLAFLGFLGFRATVSPLIPPASDAPAASAPSAASPQVVHVAFPDQVVIITHTPQPTAVPTPTYAVLPTPIPLLCGKWLDKGTVCTMPPDARPTPTPLPDCPVAGGLDCIYMGPWEGTPVVVQYGSGT